MFLSCKNQRVHCDAWLFFTFAVMKRPLLLFWICCCLVSGEVLAQTSANPFELVFRLPKAGTVAMVNEHGEHRSNNPFDIVPHRAPNISTALVENRTEPFRPFSLFPKGGGFSQSVLLWILMAMFGFLSFTIAANRSGVGKAWRSF